MFDPYHTLTSVFSISFRHSSMRSYMTDHRTPIAWRHRDMTLHGHHTPHNHHRHHHHRHRSPPSPTVTTSSSDEREEVPMVRSGHHHHPRRPNSRYGQYSQFSAAEGPFHTRPPAPYRSGGTLRWAVISYSILPILCYSSGSKNIVFCRCILYTNIFECFRWKNVYCLNNEIKRNSVVIYIIWAHEIFIFAR